MKKLLILMLTMALIACAMLCTAEESTATTEEMVMAVDTDYEVLLVEKEAQRATMTLVQHAAGDMDICILWPDSAYQTHEWTFTIDAEKVMAADYSYTDGKKRVITYDEKGGYTAQTVYEGSTGRLSIDEAGFRWTDDKDDAGKDSLFEASDTLICTVRYVDSVSQRATMSIRGEVSFDAVPMQVTIHWAEDAWTTREWQMTMLSEAMDDMISMGGAPLTYTDCVCRRITTAEDGTETVETLYENGTGSLTLVEQEDGDFGYKWQADGEQFDETPIFLPQMIAVPAVFYETGEELESASTSIYEDEPFWIQSVGTMDEAGAVVYYIDGYRFHLTEDLQAETNGEADYVRRVLAADLYAYVPEDAGDPLGDIVMFDTAEAFADWWTKNADRMEKERDKAELFFGCATDADDTVTTLLMWYIGKPVSE